MGQPIHGQAIRHPRTHIMILKRPWASRYGGLHQRSRTSRREAAARVSITSSDQGRIRERLSCSAKSAKSLTLSVASGSP